jgi:DNA-binding XRE family transcriptional regulator
MLRDVGLCQSQDDFAKTLGVAKRTIGNAEHGVHTLSLALRRALDQALEHASDAQRDRFLAAVAAHHMTISSRNAAAQPFAPGHPNDTLDGLCSAVLGIPAEQILTIGAENMAGVATTTVLSCRQQELLSVRGSLLLLLAIVATRRGDHNTARRALHNTGQLAEQLGDEGNWLWTAFGPTNVAIHQLSTQSALGDAKKMAQIAEIINTDALPAVLRGRRSQVHIELAWSAAGHADDAVAVLHLLEAERVAQQTVTRNSSARALLGILLARERRRVTPGLRALASRAGVLP